MELYSYQKELVNSKSDRIMINWCRGAGKSFGVAMYILKNKPKSVFVEGMLMYSCIVESIKSVSLQYDITIEEITSNLVKVTFNEDNTSVLIKNRFSNEETSPYELLVMSHLPIKNDNRLSHKIIKVSTSNIHKSYYKEDEPDHRIEVDYRDALKENAVSFDNIIDAALHNKDSFYREYAIKDESEKKKKVSFDEFKEDALQRLQKQFMNTNDSKDTVLTRKNIIEMIKDLKTIN